jgi:hypothetical protein
MSALRAATCIHGLQTEFVALGRDKIPPDWGWGHGEWANHAPIDGIWMASSVPGSCIVWDARIRDPESVTDRHGGIEQLRGALGPGTPVPARQLCWITDRTPHEAAAWQVLDSTTSAHPQVA